MLARLGRYGQVLQVDESGRLEAVQDRVRGLLALLRGAIQEGGEVDELLTMD